MRRFAILSVLVLAACGDAASSDAGTDAGLVPYCLGGGFPTCTDHMYVPVCETGRCAVCTSDLRVLCGEQVHLMIMDAGLVTRCVADRTTDPPATCTNVCTIDPATAGCPP